MQGRSAACTAGGLRPGCIYRVKVCAYNAVGEGKYSVPVDISTAPDVAGQPSAPHASQRWQHALHLVWKPPQHDGGSPIQAYRLEGCRGWSMSQQSQHAASCTATGCDGLHMTAGLENLGLHDLLKHCHSESLKSS